MTLLTSAVIAAIVSGLVALLTSERRIAAENVIQERMKWRDKVRELPSEVRSAFIGHDTARLTELRAQFSLRLNPHDLRDQQNSSADRTGEYGPCRGIDATCGPAP